MDWRGSGCEISWEYNYARGNQNTSEIIASKKQVDYLVILDNWALEEVGRLQKKISITVQRFMELEAVKKQLCY